MPDETIPDNDPNMRIWKEVWKVEEKYTKLIKDGKGLHSIVPMSIFKQATELWGPVGEGWGFDIEEEGMIFHDNKERPWDALYQMKIKFWYDGPLQLTPGGTALNRLPHTIGVSSPAIFEHRGGNHYANPNFYKSALTGAIINAMSRLGYGGSVRLGEHDEYTGDVEHESEADKAWGEVIVFCRETDRFPSEMTDPELIKKGTERLESKSRSRSNPSHIRLLLKDDGWSD